jgi:hypothetical protein
MQGQGLLHDAQSEGCLTRPPRGSPALGLWQLAPLALPCTAAARSSEAWD